MKKIFITALIALVATVCGADELKYGQGAENACLFVKKQMSGLSDQIVDIDIVGIDTLLTDEILILTQNEWKESKQKYKKEKNEDVLSISQERINVLSDISNSWMNPSSNAQLRKLGKYIDSWRKVYEIEVRFKVGNPKRVKVLMDKDSITPKMSETEFQIKMTGYLEDISKTLDELKKYK